MYILFFAFISFVLSDIYRVYNTNQLVNENLCFSGDYTGDPDKVDEFPCDDTNCGLFVEYPGYAKKLKRQRLIFLTCGDGHGVCEGGEHPPQREFWEGRDGKVIKGTMDCCQGKLCNAPNFTMLNYYLKDQEVMKRKWNDEGDGEESSSVANLKFASTILIILLKRFF
ncbi:unnamed protein product, partial [Mesorhabditis belari]|uniref:Uncharacterized protein n=1 Tax=Mesorhabditis belari TaxID=2138241 RepID=A0AAF3EMZ4_9BILA